MKPEVVEGARNLRAILTSDARPAILGGLNLSQEELMLRLCNDVMDADLEIKGLEERLRHGSEGKVKELEVSLATAKEGLMEQGRRITSLVTELANATRPKLEAFTPLAAALAKSPWKERRKAKPRKAKH